MARKHYAPRLNAYVRRTILASATEYAYPKKRRTKESTKSAFQDALHGTNTGWWNDLTYTRDAFALFNRHRADVAACIREYLSETGQPASDKVRRDDDVTFADMLASVARKQTFAQFTGTDDARAKEASAAELAICFAVEWLAGELAREYAPDL